MPIEETRQPFTEEEKGKVLDPNPERRKHLTELFFKYATGKIASADLIGYSRKKLSRVAEIAYIKYKYGRYKEALELFQTLASLDHTNPYYHAALGGVHQKMGRFVDAVVEYTRALKINPKDVCSHVNRGEVYLRHRNFRKAADDFREAILLDEEGKNLWANRARSLVIALKRNLEMRRAAVPPALKKPGARPAARRAAPRRRPTVH